MLRQEQYGASYPLEERFPQMRFIWGWEGGGLFACEQADLYYLIVDERTLAEFLQESDPTNASVLQRLVTVLAFDTEEERRDHLNNLVLQSLGYNLIQETEAEKTYVDPIFKHNVTIPRSIEITKEMIHNIRRERRAKNSYH